MRKKLWIIATIFVLAIGSLLAMNGEATGAKKGKDNNTSQNNGKVKNVIVMIGDGMGPSYPTAYRYMKDDPSTPKMEKTVFDKHLVGMATTYADDPEENITDSAAAATSMSAGIKTYNGAIAVDTERSEVETVLEAAKKKANLQVLLPHHKLTMPLQQLLEHMMNPEGIIMKLLMITSMK